MGLSCILQALQTALKEIQKCIESDTHNIEKGYKYWKIQTLKWIQYWNRNRTPKEIQILKHMHIETVKYDLNPENVVESSNLNILSG